jgi:hypothetical protein
MSDKTNSNLPDPFDEEALLRRLNSWPRSFFIAFAARMALLALPGLGTLKAKDLKVSWVPSHTLSSFRASWASWFAAKSPSEEASAAAFAAYAATASGPEIASRVGGEVLSSFAAASSSGRAAADAASNIRWPEDVQAAAAAARNAGATGVSAAEKEEIRTQIIAAMKGLQTAEGRDDSVAWFLERPIWIDRTLPQVFAERWANLRRILPRDQNWDVWLDWAEARFRGEQDWPTAVYNELAQWREEWDRDPARVNADIKALLVKHKSEDPGPRGPGAKLEFDGQEIVFAKSNAFPERDLRPVELHARCRELVNALLTDNQPFPPGLQAGLEKLKAVLNAELAEVPPIELFIAAAAVLAKADAASIRQPNELSDRAVENLLGLGLLLDPLMAFVLGDIDDARKKLKELRLEQETVRAIAEDSPRVLEIFQNLPVISAKVTASFGQSAQIAVTAEGHTEALWAAGGFLFQVKELAWVTNENLTKTAEMGAKPLLAKNADITRKIMSPEYRQQLKANLDTAIDKSSEPDKLAGHIEFGVRGGITSLGVALTWLSINYPLFMLAVPPLLMALISRKLEKVGEEAKRANQPSPAAEVAQKPNPPEQKK